MQFKLYKVIIIFIFVITFFTIEYIIIIPCIIIYMLWMLHKNVFKCNFDVHGRHSIIVLLINSLLLYKTCYLFKQRIKAYII